MLLFSGKVAGSLIQQIGRVSRQKEMNIITLSPESDRGAIPIYTKGTKERDKMIASYYKDCDIRQKEVYESELARLNIEN